MPEILEEQEDYFLSMSGILSGNSIVSWGRRQCSGPPFAE
jgi:hypothetical protein